MYFIAKTHKYRLQIYKYTNMIRIRKRYIV